MSNNIGYCSYVRDLAAHKILPRKARLFATTWALPTYQSYQMRFKVQIVSSGAFYYGSLFSVVAHTQYSRDWIFADSVFSNVRWWAQIRYPDGSICYGIEGPTFYVPM
jgi:hypothetical protein